MSKTKYRDIYDPVEEVIGRFLSGVGQHPSEDDLIAAIDHKYSNIQWEVLYLKRQGYKPEQIMKILHIGEMSYQRAIEVLQKGGHWKEYKRNEDNKVGRGKVEGKQALQERPKKD